jgi:hypothetical protein
MIRPFWATQEALARPARALRLIGSTLVVSVVLGTVYVVAGLFVDFTDMRVVAVYALAGSVRDVDGSKRRAPIGFALVIFLRSPVGPRTRWPALGALVSVALAVALAAASNLSTVSVGALGNPIALGLAAGAGVGGLAFVAALVVMLRGFAIELGVPELARLARGVFVAGGIVGVVLGAGGAAWAASVAVMLVGGGVVLNRLLMLLHLLAGACETADGVAETFA